MTRRISSFCLALLALCSSLRADTAVTLRGTVIDPGGRPVPGARVWIDDWTIIDPPPANAVAGADGGFAIPGLLDRPQFLVICAEGFLQADEIVPFPGEPVQITLMKPAARVRGRVLGPDGEPLPGARVRALPSTYNGGIRTVGVRACPAEDFATADAEGRVAFGRLEPVQTRLLATADGLRPGATDWFELEAGQPVEEHEIRLQPGAVLKGRVFDPAGAPIPGARVKTSVAWSELEAVAGADGTFTLSGLEEGQLRLFAWAEHFQNRTVDIDKWPDEETLDAEPVEIVLERKEAPIEVSGRVLGPGGAPVEGATVFGYGTPLRSARDGSFALRIEKCSECTEAQEVTLVARKTGLAPGRVTLLLTADRIKGVIISLETGTRVTGRVLGVAADDLRAVSYTLSRPPADGGNLETLSLDSTGRFRLGPFPSGTWKIDAVSGLRHATATLVLAPGRTRVSVDLTFPPAWEVSGRVLDPEGRPVPHAPVYLSDAMEERNRIFTWTHLDGTFSLRAPAGDFLLTASHEGLGSSLPLRVRGGPVAGFEVHLERRAEEAP